LIQDNGAHPFVRISIAAVVFVIIVNRDEPARRLASIETAKSFRFEIAVRKP
jgi:hypothetical protein